MHGMLTYTQSAPSSILRTIPSSTIEPQSSAQVVTESGAVITKVIIWTPTATPSASASASASASTAPVETPEKKSANTGAIVGGVVGGVLGLLAVGGGILFFLWRRKKQQRAAHDDGYGGIGGGSNGVTRNTSTMSKAGLLPGTTGAGRGMQQYPPRIATGFGSQHSRNGDPENMSISPISNRRNSQPLIVDSRLNPTAVLTFANVNASRDSLVSMDDSRDYGRQLNVRSSIDSLTTSYAHMPQVRNPDPTPRA
jgi:cell wall integrity and stress response component